MAGANQLLPGFNHNVTHRGRQYHVQTEDSGTANPHVVTHLFHGGNVLASKKTSYAELLSEGGELAARVRTLMESQHKDMLRQLVRGAFDAGAARAYQPGEIHVAEPATPAPPAEAPSSSEPVAPAQPEPAVAAPPVAPEPEPDPDALEFPLLDVPLVELELEEEPAEDLGAIAPDAAPAPAVLSPQPPAAPELPLVPPRAVDGWGPPVLPRVNRPPSAPVSDAPPPAPAPAPGARRLDELILSYLAGDLAAKHDGR